MPVHDWSKVDANVFHHFHQRWTIAICDTLNAGLLPRDFSALVEQHASGLMADAFPGRGNQVGIRQRLTKLACVIDIVSPENKASRDRLRSFVTKALEFLRQGINLLVIDLLPPTPHAPQGIHKAIWDGLEEQPFAVPLDRRLTLVAYVAGGQNPVGAIEAFVEPIGIGDLLPDMPACVNRGRYVPVPLEATYQSAFATCPEVMRVLVATGRLPGESG